LAIALDPGYPRNAEWGAGNAEWGAGNAEWGAGNAEWGAGNAEWGAENAEWGVENAEWGAGNAEWGAGNAEWGAGNAEWGAGNAEWGMIWRYSALRIPHSAFKDDRHDVRRPVHSGCVCAPIILYFDVDVGHDWTALTSEQARTLEGRSCVEASGGSH
jgi:hypothetical protein